MSLIKYRILFYLLIDFVLLFSCKQKKAENTQHLISAYKDSINQSKAVVIRGVTDDPMAFNYMNFIDYSYFNGTNHDKLNTKKIENTTEFKLGSINQPQIIELFSFGDSTNYNTRVFVKPGDTVVMSINKKNIDFKGKNAAHYNFFNELDSKNNEWASNIYKGNLQDYKNRVDSIFKRRQKFFEKYIMENAVSKDFIEHVGSELKFEYLYNLIAPRSVDSETGLGINNQEIVVLISKDVNVEKDGFFDLKSYFNSITIEDFKRPELINNDYFKRSLVPLIRFYFANTDFLNYSVENFEIEEEYIKNNLEGELREFALTRLIYDYNNKGFGQGKHDNKLLKKLLSEQKIQIKKSSLKDVLSSIEKNLNRDGYKFSENETNDLLISISGNTLMFDEILKKEPKKIKVLDFWASWCTPCLVEIKKSQALRKELEEKYGLEWIFISVDANINNWKSTTKKLYQYLNDENQYRLVDTENSGLLKFLTNESTDQFMVPRYVIIDSISEIISSQAPRPSDSLVFKNLIEKINLKN